VKAQRVSEKAVKLEESKETTREAIYRKTRCSVDECPVQPKVEMWHLGALLSSSLSPELSEVCRVIKLDLSDVSHPVNVLITKFQTVMMASLEPKLQMLEMLLNKEPAKLLDVDSNRLTRLTQSLNLRMSKMKPKSSFNADRFEGMPAETVFAEVLLLEV
jgi:hypothetical protein